MQPKTPVRQFPPSRPIPPSAAGLRSAVDAAKANSGADRHALASYADLDELSVLCENAINEAAAEGYAWWCVLAIDQIDAVRKRLSGPGTKGGSVVDFDTLDILEAPINVERIVGHFRTKAEASVKQGYNGLLLLIESSWLVRMASSMAHQGEYEVALHRMLEETPARAVCLYDRRLFTDTMLLDALTTHPTVLDRRSAYRNPHFLPPDVYLSRDASDQLHCWLSAIDPHVSGHWTADPKAKKRVATRLSSKWTARSATPNIAEYDVDDIDQIVTEPGAEQRWKIRCLGPLRVYRSDGSQVQWNVVNGATRKTKTLFSYLLFKGRNGAESEEIADLLWPESESTKQSLNRLYHTIHCLRMALSPELKSSRDSPFVVSTDQRYRLLLPQNTWIDMPHFEDFCRRGETLVKDGDLDHALTCHLAAEKLYAGSLFADIPTKYAESIDQDWCWSRRYWLEETFLKMLVYLTGIFRQRGDIDEALSRGERALTLNVCYEPAHREMMRSYHLAGRRDALERQYRVCCGALKRYYDSPPSDETEKLYLDLTALT